MLMQSSDPSNRHREIHFSHYAFPLLPNTDVTSSGTHPFIERSCVHILETSIAVSHHIASRCRQCYVKANRRAGSRCRLKLLLLGPISMVCAFTT